MKIAVYTIALNEEKHVKRWYESAKEADLLLIADTGSTDKTRFVAKALGIEVRQISVEPWRFDVARNASLALIPSDFDMCIQLDMDEVLSPGWREQVEIAFRAGNHWPLYKQVTSRNPDGSIRTAFDYFKIHPRKGFIWKYPIHEVVTPINGTTYVRKAIDLEVDHIQDHGKSRNSYLHLLETAVREEPNDWRMHHYLNREYFYKKDWVQVIRTAYECDEIIGGWDIERASTYMWASEACHHLGFRRLAKWWAQEATSAAPEFYEAWHWRAHIAHLYSEWENCLEFASYRLKLSRGVHHLVKPDVWEWWGYDLIALASHRLGLHADAVFYGEIAWFHAQDNVRLRENVGFYRAAHDRSSLNNLEISVQEKLRTFPTVFYINVDSDIKRRDLLEAELKSSGIDFVRVPALTPEDIAGLRQKEDACLFSHFRALEYFLDSTEDEWAVIAEDDLTFETVAKWNFTWAELFEKITKQGINIYQLALSANCPENFEDRLHPRREGYDWSTACYLISRIGAAQLLERRSLFPNLPLLPESALFDDQKVFTEALLTTRIGESTLHPEQDFASALAFKLTFERLGDRAL